jgi:ATP-dependent exoDNAse (exonuclease V) beta subunit
LSLNQKELEFLATGPIPEAGAIAEAAGAAREERADKTANLLYVAATRAAQSLSIVLRADKEGGLKGFSSLMEQTAREPIPDAERTESGWQCDYGPAEPEPRDYEELSAPELAEGPSAPLDSDDLDPALRSADIEAGIERGIRIHAALAQITAENRRLSLAWNLNCTLSMLNYRIHTDAIKAHLIPAAVTKSGNHGSSALAIRARKDRKQNDKMKGAFGILQVISFT